MHDEAKRRRFVVALTVGLGLVVATLPLNVPGGAGRVAMGERAAPAPPTTPIPAPVVNLLGGTPAYGTNGPVSFTFARHYYHPGDTVSASFHLTTRECRILACDLGTIWTAAGAPSNHCAASAVHCSWRLAAATPLYQWQSARMPITTTMGMQESDDFFAVVPLGQSVLEMHVTNAAGVPYSSLPLRLSGPISATLPTDGNGYAVALAPSGRYTVRLDAGTASADKSFRDESLSLSLHGVVQTHIIGYNRVQVHVSDVASLPADGLEVITVTVHTTNPLGQPVPSMPLITAVSGPNAVLCTLPPLSVGYVEPWNGGDGAPLYRPVAQITDGAGNLSYQVYLGTGAGVWRISVRDDSVGTRDPWYTRLVATASVRIKPATWAHFFPARFVVPLYGVRGRATPATLLLSQVLWNALHGTTVRFAPKQTNGLTLTGLNAGDAVGSQKMVLQWLETFVPLAGLEIGPVYSGGSTNWGVAIFVHDRYSAGGVTRVLTARALAALIASPTAAKLPDLPTLSAWALSTHSRVERGYAQPSVESRLTYNGLPYLPRNPSLLSSFEGNCLQKASLPH